MRMQRNGHGQEPPGALAAVISSCSPAVRGAGTSKSSGHRMTCRMQVGAYSTQQVLPEMLCNGRLRDAVYLGAWRVGNPIAP